MLYKRATLTERFAEKLKKYKLDLRFLITSRDKGVYPKFRRWKNLKTRRIKKKKFSRRILLDEIGSKSKAIKMLREQHTTSINHLLNQILVSTIHEKT